MPLSLLGGTLDTAPAFATPTFDINPRPLSSVSANLTPGQAFRVGDRIKDTAAVTSSVLVTLNKANPASFSNFQDGVGDGNSCFYCMADSAGNWEVQYGVYTDAAGTLSRGVPISSSTTPGQQVTFSGAVTVFGNWPAGAELATGYGIQPGYFVGRPNCSVGPNTIRSNTVFYVPVMLPTAFSGFSAMFAGGSATTGTNVDVGLYSNWRGAPYKLLGQQTGMVAPSITAQVTSPIACPPSPPGLYWAALVARNNGGAEGTGSFWTISTISGPPGDLMGVKAVNTSFAGYYESGVQLPGIANQALTRSSGSAPFVPNVWISPIL